MIRLAMLLLPALLTLPAAATSFRLTYDASIAERFSGDVYVLLSQTANREPRFGPRPMQTEPFYALEVTDWKPGQPLIVNDDNTRGMPVSMSKLPPGNWIAQAVMRLNRDVPAIGRGGGNAYSSTAVVKVAAGVDPGETVLHMDKQAPPQVLPESDDIKLVEMRSELLSAFHGRDVIMRAGVILPEGYNPRANDRRYPVQFWLPRYGGDERSVGRFKSRVGAAGQNDRFFRVVPSTICYGGAHYFVDSPNNGPWGTAFVEEFIPHLERLFPIMPDANARFLAGHGAGGWAALWLQISHPTVFGGVWATAPEPVTFRAYHRADIYKPDANLYKTPSGLRLPYSQRASRVFIWNDEAGRLDYVYGPGMWFGSNEHAYSPRGDDGKPLRLFDRVTGAVDPAVAARWRQYDLLDVLQSRWPELAADLNGKIRIFVGDQDNYNYQTAVRLLDTAMRAMGAGVTIETYAGADHGTVLNTYLRQRMDAEMLSIFDAHHPR